MEMTYRDAIAAALREEMQRDPSVFLIGEDVARYGGAFGVTKGLLEEFGARRVRSTPISELGITGLGVGAAAMGLRPVVEIMYVDFTLLALDQIVNQAAKFRYRSGGQVEVPMVIRTAQGAGRGSGVHHSQSLEAIFYHFPGIKIAIPATPADATGLLKAAIRDPDPVVFIESKSLYNTKGEVPEGELVLPLGKGRIARHGSDLTIIAIGNMLPIALQAAEVLQQEQISVEVIDPRTLVPLDLPLLEQSLTKTKRVMVTHQAPSQGGVGSDLLARLMETPAFYYLDAPPLRVGGKLLPLAYQPTLEAAAVPSQQELIDAARRLMGRI